MKYFIWLLKAAIFFSLFAFALNNQQTVAVNFFFGTKWIAPLVLVVLATFSLGLGLGVLLMMPRWWKKRKTKSSLSTALVVPTVHQTVATTSMTVTENKDIPRDGL